MSHLALRFSQEIGELDLQRDGDGYLKDETTATLVATSLFTDRRKSGARGPEARGYWADALLGSSLWQLLGQPQTPQSQLAFEAEIRRCLSWLEPAGQMTVGAVVVEPDGERTALQVEVERGAKVDVTKWGKEAGFYVG